MFFGPRLGQILGLLGQFGVSEIGHPEPRAEKRENS